jgi:hypothetical protein
MHTALAQTLRLSAAATPAYVSRASYEDSKHLFAECAAYRHRSCVMHYCQLRNNMLGTQSSPACMICVPEHLKLVITSYHPHCIVTELETAFFTNDLHSNIYIYLQRRVLVHRSICFSSKLRQGLRYAWPTAAADASSKQLRHGWLPSAQGSCSA